MKPGQDPENQSADSFFALINLGTKLIGYTANGSTRRFEGTTLENLVFQPGVVLSPPTGIRDPDGLAFDSCGRWLTAADVVDANLVRGWYHGERGCSKDDEVKAQTYWSVGYAESNRYTDPGIIVGNEFTEPLNNLVVQSSEGWVPHESRGHANQTVIKWGQHYYMFFMNTDLDQPSSGPVFDSLADHDHMSQRSWTQSVARSPISSAGKPGTWTKFWNGSWNSPGVGGHATKLTTTDGGLIIAGAVSRFLSWDDRLVQIGVNKWDHGVILYFSQPNDATLPWQRLQSPLLYTEDTDWTRTDPMQPAPATELIAYPSIVTADGTGQWDTRFWLIYVYVQPNEYLDQRYIVRREVQVSNRTAIDPSPHPVKLVLSQYHNSPTNDFWATTAPALGESYAKLADIGYVYTSALPGTIPIDDCDIRPTGFGHMTAWQGECPADRVLRTLGWIWDNSAGARLPNVQPLFRCYDPAIKRHKVSLNASCDGFPEVKQLGYIETEPRAIFRELFSPSRNDSWETTATPTPDGYEAQHEIGYLYKSAGPGKIPVKDCFIQLDTWLDHFICPGADCSCNGAEDFGVMGYIWDVETGPQKVNTRPLYRCWNPTKKDHSVSYDSQCADQVGYQVEWICGYIDVK